MELYYVLFTDDDGCDFNLFVWASSPREAADLWHKHCGWEYEVEPRDIWLVPHTPPPASKVLPWAEEGGVTLQDTEPVS